MTDPAAVNSSMCRDSLSFRDSRSRSHTCHTWVASTSEVPEAGARLDEHAHHLAPRPSTGLQPRWQCLAVHEFDGDIYLASGLTARDRKSVV